MNVIEFFKTNKESVNLLTHAMTDSEWYKNQADESQKSLASMLMADVLTATGMKIDSKQEAFKLLQQAVMSNKSKELVEPNGYQSSFGSLLTTIF